MNDAQDALAIEAAIGDFADAIEKAAHALRVIEQCGRGTSVGLNAADQLGALLYGRRKMDGTSIVLSPDSLEADSHWFEMERRASVEEVREENGLMALLAISGGKNQ
jgi:hypothetical protein